MRNHLVASLLVLATSSAHADHRNSRTTLTTATHVQSIYERISYTVPEEQCWQERVAIREHRSATGPILGAIIGG